MNTDYPVQKIVKLIHTWTRRALNGESGMITKFPLSVARLRLALIEDRLFHGTEIQAGLDACLLEAIANGDLQASEFLVGQGASPTNGFPSPLEIAAKYGHLEIVLWLLSKGCDLDHALLHAVHADKTSLIKELLARSPDRLAAASTALKWGNHAGTETLRVLIEAGADVTSFGPNALWGAAERGDEEAFAMLVGAFSGTSWTARPFLVPAASGGSAVIVRMILDARPVQDAEVMGKAIEAAVSQHAEAVIEVLISRGASLQLCLEKVVEYNCPFLLGILSQCGLVFATLDPEWVRNWIGHATPRMVESLLAHGMPERLATLE